MSRGIYSIRGRLHGRARGRIYSVRELGKKVRTNFCRGCIIYGYFLNLKEIVRDRGRGGGYYHGRVVSNADVYKLKILSLKFRCRLQRRSDVLLEYIYPYVINVISLKLQHLHNHLHLI